MEPIVLAELTSHTPGASDSERRLHSRERSSPERFAPLWLRASLLLATLGILWLLYPKYYIENSLRRQPAPDSATLVYLRLIVLAQPAVTETRVLLAEQALAAGNVSLARYGLAPWAKRGLEAIPLKIALLRLRLLRVELYAARPASMRHAELTAAYTRAVLLLAPRLAASELLRHARAVAGLGEYRAAARLYRQIMATSDDRAVRLKAFYGGIAALRAAGQPFDALAFARSELAAVPPSVGLWREMTRLALMADAPRLAASYARRLIGIEPP
jgi:hypothetical protein